MDYRAGSQSTLTKSQMPPHPQMVAPHISDHHEQMIKMANGGGGSPRNYPSIDRYSNAPTIPQAPPHYTPYQFNNSLQRSAAGTPLPIQPNQHMMQMQQQMSMPAPTPPPPYGGSQMTPVPMQINGGMHQQMAPASLASHLPPHQAGSMQFGVPMPQNQMQLQQLEMQYNAQLVAQQNQFAATATLQQMQPVQQQMPNVAQNVGGSVNSVNSSVRSRSKSWTRGRGKTIVLRVLLLDGTTPRFEVPAKCKGFEFFQKVVDHLNLLETDYFGLQYAADHAGSVYWLELQKSINDQVNTPTGILFRFAVKFYTPDPGQLQDEYTKVLFALQIKRDMACGMLPCAENTAALMASYVVQAELGDYDAEKNAPGPGGPMDRPRYLSMFKFIPSQSDEFLVKVMEYHRNHIGQTPADADYNLLDIARRLDMYGIRLHPARDQEAVLMHIAVNHAGILVFQHFQKYATYSWSKVRKLSFRKKMFIVKLHSDAVAAYGREWVGYNMTSRNACKRFWMDCIEHHAFFRCSQNAHGPTVGTKPAAANGVGRLFHSGSTYRYSGRTQREMHEEVRTGNQARLQLRRPGSAMGAPFSRTMPPNAMDGGTPVGGGGVSSMHSLQLHPQRGVRPELDLAGAPLTQPGMMHQQQPQLPTSMAYGSMQMPPQHGGLPPNARASPLPLGPYPPGSAPGQMMTPLMQQRSGTPLSMDGGGGRQQPLMFASIPPQQMQSPLGSVSPTSGYPPHHFSSAAASNMAQAPPMASRPIALPPHLAASHGQGYPGMQHQQEADNGCESDHEYENYPVPEDLQPITNGHVSRSAAMPGQRESFAEANTAHAMVPNDRALPPPGAHGPPGAMGHFGGSTSSHHDMGANSSDRSRDSALITAETADDVLASAAAAGAMSPLTQESLAGTGQDEGFRQRRDSDGDSSAMLGPNPHNPGGLLDDDIKRRKVISGKSYYVAKEIVSTERTYIKDLEVITTSFRRAVMSANAMQSLPMNGSAFFNCFGSILDQHTFFLKEIESRLTVWDGGKPGVIGGGGGLKGDYQRVGDILLRHVKNIAPVYESYLSRQNDLLLELEDSLVRSKKLEGIFKDFEQQKHCYLPLTAFLLKPAQRLLHYELLLERLLKFYPPEHRDHAECKEASEYLTPLVHITHLHLENMEHNQKLAELQRDLLGVTELMSPGRNLIREGSLYKQATKSNQGFRQRMFFLFSDVLLYTSRGVTSTNQFKVQEAIPLSSAVLYPQPPPSIADSLAPNDPAVPNPAHVFLLEYTPDAESPSDSRRHAVLAASSEAEKEAWITDLQVAIEEAQESIAALETDGDAGMVPEPVQLVRTSAQDQAEAADAAPDSDNESETGAAAAGADKVSYHRSNTTMHVCWHRNTSVSMNSHVRSIQNQLSGYLLRKFKNSNGWQKLWVVFTNFCLFFYKTYHEDFPLASLPLLGYSICLPDEADGIQKDYVFKLQFKTHVYFFRAESDYTFNRWLEVIGCATDS